MIMTNALEVINRLDETSVKRLQHYLTDIGESKNKELFDKRAYLYLKSISKDGGKLVDVVKDYLDQIGWSQSYYQADKMKIQVVRFGGDNHLYTGWKSNFRKTVDECKTSLIEANRHKLKMLRYDTNKDVLDALPRLDTHPGFSFLTTGNRKKGDFTEEILSAYLEEEANAKKHKSFNKPIMLGTRTQSKPPYDDKTGDILDKPVNDLMKTRLVSMIDIWQVLAECKFAKPLQHMLNETDWYMGGKNDVATSTMVRRAHNIYPYWASLDYSSYDQSISDWLIWAAFDIIKGCFYDDGFDNELFEIVRNDFIHKVFITPWGHIESHKGVPSGSMFTQVVDSIVNYLMISCYMKVKKITRFKMFIMGDDNLIYTDVELDLRDISAYLGKEFGIEMNAMKADSGTFRDDPAFLSRFWTANGVWRLPQILIAKLLFPESFRAYDRFGFTPDMVVDSYFESFPLGMNQAFDSGKHHTYKLKSEEKMTASKYLTGSARYKLLYSGNNA